MTISAIIGNILLGLGAFFTFYIINNTKLRDGVTEWFLNFIGKGKFDITTHNVKDTIQDLKFKSKHTEFNNALKTDLYHFYVEKVLVTMETLVDEIIEAEKQKNLRDFKSFIKQKMYNRLSEINEEIDRRVLMPDPLQDKFDKFKNYLTKQHTHAIDNALSVNNKKLMSIKVLDAIEHNSMWFLFYTTEMFENFNGHFNNLQKSDVFKY